MPPSASHNESKSRALSSWVDASAVSGVYRKQEE